MSTWTEFAAAAPRIAEIFRRRHTATRNLCLLATTRADGYPRISPLEPRVFEGELWLGGMPETRKFADLRRDPRFCLHTATTDPEVTEGDAKLFGTVHDVRDEALHQRYAQSLYEDTGFDLRGHAFNPFYAADITSASAIEVSDDRMDVIIWKPGHGEYVVRKH
ncbi:pyridoxamine 5'-phosphate oxidase family protein [Nocardia sp. NPDC051570]|uniref:pyridoxamine 5'-phosphate oxidase family protein n=1 Tax=Nocardia sp. NPDC051570 TaxID=3364324 RepID=UPI003789557F